MTKTKEIDLSAAQADMVLARAAVSPAGRTLAAPGKVLTGTLIEGFLALGVTHLTVLVPDEPAPSAATRAERIAFLFRKAENDPLRDALRRALEQYRNGEGPT